MLKKIKFLIGVMAAILSVTAMVMPIMAAEEGNGDPELTIETDKSEYSDFDNITETIKIKNPGSHPLTDIEIKAEIPEGYVIDETENFAVGGVYTIPQIAAGDSSTVSIVFAPNGKQGTDTPKAGGFTHTGILIFAMIISAGIIAYIVKTRKGKRFIAFFLMLFLVCALVPVVSGHKAYASEKGNTDNVLTVTKSIKVGDNELKLTVSIKYEKEKLLSYEGYNLKWQDDFTETTLNRDDWNVELHDVGWVNNEKQEYVDSDENIYIKDGKLFIKPVKSVDISGKVSYTSGRINTQNKHNFKYGIFEARVKVPEGKGYLPAFWLMAADENIYGQWPRCGEIDAMEVKGDDTSTAYGTIHYGNPHKECQGTETLNDDSYSDSYHTIAVEWLPGKINWYMDGVLFHSADDWYSRTENQGEITYPAPFDQEFYMILNLAVGGSWVGDPDDSTDFENQTFSVDYVKVYQKESYDENVVKPESKVALRDPDENGNYINNGTFTVKEDLNDDDNWKFLTALEGEAEAVIDNERININITNDGTVDYSVQLVQPDIPLKKGGNYQITFDAWADEARTMKVSVTGPDNGYVRYMNDTKLDLSSTKRQYTLDFTMNQDDDANGRLEFNMGNAESTANIHITNVVLKKLSQNDTSNEEKTVLADGNSVYNGKFQEGTGHMGFWNFSPENAEYSVTPIENGRRLKITAQEGTSDTNPVIISQNGLALNTGTQYSLNFKAEGENGKSIKTTIAGRSFNSVLDGNYNYYEYGFTMPDEVDVNKIAFIINEPGIYYIDEIYVVEDSLIKNGSFNAGLAGYSPYIDSTADATCVADNLTEDNVAALTINNTGDQAWKIQLKQENITLEKNQWYRLSLDAKSSIARKIMFAIQRDGSNDDNWDPYSGEKIVNLDEDYQTFTIEFQMKKETDAKALLSISMGAVGGTQITTQHQVCIDNIKLEKIDAPVIEATPSGENLLKNPNFANGNENWEATVTSPAAATTDFAGNKVVYDISALGTADWNVQLKQRGITLENGKTYRVKFKALSSESRTIKLAMLTTDNDWYCGDDIILTKDVEKDVDVTLTITKPTDTNMVMVVSMGTIEGIATPLSQITLSDFSLVKE